jgi:hypothetical protein
MSHNDNNNGAELMKRTGMDVYNALDECPWIQEMIRGFYDAPVVQQALDAHKEMLSHLKDLRQTFTCDPSGPECFRGPVWIDMTTGKLPLQKSDWIKFLFECDWVVSTRSLNPFFTMDGVRRFDDDYELY